MSDHLLQATHPGGAEATPPLARLPELSATLKAALAEGAHAFLTVETAFGCIGSLLRPHLGGEGDLVSLSRADADACLRAIGQVVGALQFDDITGQRIRSVTCALDQLAAQYACPKTGAADDRVGPPRVARAECDIELF